MQNEPAPPEDESVCGPSVAATEATLRLHAERVSVARRARPTSVVRASSVTRTREQQIDEALWVEHVDVLRVPIGRRVDACPAVRTEGDVTILSIVEEVLVVERRLVLTEEVHMIRRRTVRPHQETVTLREQHVVITRMPIDELTHRQAEPSTS